MSVCDICEKPVDEPYHATIGNPDGLVEFEINHVCERCRNDVEELLDEVVEEGFVLLKLLVKYLNEKPESEGFGSE